MRAPALGGGNWGAGVPTGGATFGATDPLCGPIGPPTAGGGGRAGAAPPGTGGCTIAPGGKFTLKARRGGKFVNGGAKFWPTVLFTETGPPGGNVAASGGVNAESPVNPPMPVFVTSGWTVVFACGKPTAAAGLFRSGVPGVKGGVMLGREKVLPTGAPAPAGPTFTVPAPAGPAIVGAPAAGTTPEGVPNPGPVMRG
jgi:hypothetical protein